MLRKKLWNDLVLCIPVTNINKRLYMPNGLPLGMPDRFLKSTRTVFEVFFNIWQTTNLGEGKLNANHL